MLCIQRATPVAPVSRASLFPILLIRCLHRSSLIPVCRLPYLGLFLSTTFRSFLHYYYYYYYSSVCVCALSRIVCEERREFICSGLKCDISEYESNIVYGKLRLGSSRCNPLENLWLKVSCREKRKLQKPRFQHTFASVR